MRKRGTSILQTVLHILVAFVLWISMEDAPFRWEFFVIMLVFLPAIRLVDEWDRS